MLYSVCVDNLNLVSINKIDIDWDTPFLNLYFDREKARAKLFADNGKHWQYSDTDYSFKTINLNVYLDDNDHINGLSMYKYKTTSFNHGKNSSTELKVSASDIKEATAKLQEVILDTTEKELNQLLTKLQESDFGKERQIKIRKNDITLLDKNGQPQTIKQKALLKAIQISHTYLEILHNDTVFNNDPKEFPQEIHATLHEILSFIDTSNYYSLDELKYQMKMRELIATADDGYAKLRQAVLDGNLDEINRLIIYAKLVPLENPEGSPLYHAVNTNRIDIAKTLLENSAYVLEMDRDGSRFPLEVAYRNDNPDMVRLLVEYHGATIKTFNVRKHNIDNLLKLCTANKDYETLELIAPYVFGSDSNIWLEPDMFPNLTREEIETINKYPGIRIAWGLDQIRPLYEQKDYEFCKRVLLQGCKKEVVEFFVAENNYEMFEASLARHTALETKKTFEPIFERDKKWYDYLCAHTKKTILPNGRIIYSIDNVMGDYLIKLLDNAEFDKYIQKLNEFDVYGTPGLGNYHTIYYPEKVDNPEAYRSFANYMLDHYDITTRCSFLEDIVKYFGDEELTHKYNRQCPLKKDYNSASVDAFWKNFAHYQLLPKYIEDKNATFITGAEIIRSSFGIEPFENKGEVASWTTGNIISVCSGRQPPLSGEEERENRCKRAVNCMKALLEKVSIEELNEGIKEQYKYNNINNIHELFKNREITYQPMLDLIEHQK